MKKIFYLNPSVGSGIEYAGNIFANWLQDSQKEYDLINYKYQNPSYLVFQDIINERPDIIILNEYHIQNVRAVLHYKMLNKNVKVLYIIHVWKYLFDILENSFVEKKGNSFLLETTDHHHFVFNSVDEASDLVQITGTNSVEDPRVLFSHLLLNIFQSNTKCLSLRQFLEE